MVQEDLFEAGRLLLQEVPSSGEVAAAGGSVPVLAAVYVGLSVLLLLQLIRPLLELIPSLGDSVFRARGSTALESSVRLSRDRLLISLALLLPLSLLVFRYRLYDPDFVSGLSANARLATISGVLAAWVLLRWILYRWFMPRRRYDFYQIAHRSAFTFFILLMLLMLLTAGVLSVVRANDFTVRVFLYVEMMVLYTAFLFRRMQFLSLSCSQLLTFLYLCALELIPSALLVISAVVL